MSKLSRRDFLKVIAAGASGTLLSGCGQPAPAPTAAPPTRTPLPPPTLVPPSATPLPTNVPTAAPTATPKPIPELVVARGENPEEMIRQAMKALGGMEKFVKKGAEVIIKPNMCVGYRTYEYAATTNPWLVGGIVKLCLEAGAKRVRVMDFPFDGTQQQAYTQSGVEKEVKAAGGLMEFMAAFKYTKVKLPNALELKESEIYDDFLKADNVIINVPIAKHHAAARLTLGMKNFMGVIVDREVIHHNLGQRIADLNTKIKPMLTVMDGTRILMANGPQGGNLNDVKKMNTIAVSQDIVAVDSYATQWFNLKPDDIAYIVAGAKMGLGRSDLKSVRIEEINV